MKIKHEDVFKYFWKLEQDNGITVQKIYVKYTAYLPEIKSYFFAAGESDPENGNGAELSFFQDKEYFLIPPE